jgi:hypothetical protein
MKLLMVLKKNPWLHLSCLSHLEEDRYEAWHPFSRTSFRCQNGKQKKVEAQRKGNNKRTQEWEKKKESRKNVNKEVI